MPVGTPLQVFDNFILGYNVGQVLLLLFVFTTLGAAIRSLKILSLNTMAFGLVFVLTPGSVSPFNFRLLGLVLVVVGPIVYAFASQ